MRNRFLAVLAVLGALVLALSFAPSASAADYSKWPSAQGNPDGDWNVQHSSRGADAFDYLLVACGNGQKFKIAENKVDPCRGGATQYHIPSGCRTLLGVKKGPQWVNTHGKRIAVALTGAGCTS